jgi:hypothetical protein
VSAIDPRQFHSPEIPGLCSAHPEEAHRAVSKDLPLPGIAAPPSDPGQGESHRADPPFITLPSLRALRASRAARLPQATAGSCDPAPAEPCALSASLAPRVPGGQGAFLPGLDPGGSLQLVLGKRLEHLAKGYDPSHDLRLPIGFLLNEGMRYGADARDWLTRPGQDPDRRHFEGKLVNLGALVLAELDRLHATRAASAA